MDRIIIGSNTGYRISVDNKEETKIEIAANSIITIPEGPQGPQGPQGEPADPGEIGVAVAAPAIANALHSATGLRFRRLPLLSEGL